MTRVIYSFDHLIKTIAVSFLQKLKDGTLVGERSVVHLKLGIICFNSQSVLDSEALNNELNRTETRKIWHDGRFSVKASDSS